MQEPPPLPTVFHPYSDDGVSRRGAVLRIKTLACVFFSTPGSFVIRRRRRRRRETNMVCDFGGGEEYLKFSDSHCQHAAAIRRLRAAFALFRPHYCLYPTCTPRHTPAQFLGKQINSTVRATVQTAYFPLCVLRINAVSSSTRYFHLLRTSEPGTVCTNIKMFVYVHALHDFRASRLNDEKSTLKNSGRKWRTTRSDVNVSQYFSQRYRKQTLFS